MRKFVILCDHDAAWDESLREQFRNEDVLFSPVDEIEDIDEGTLLKGKADMVVCSVDDFYNWMEYKAAGERALKKEAPLFVIADEYSLSDEINAMTAGCLDYQARSRPMEALAWRIRNRLMDADEGADVYVDADTADVYVDGALLNLTGRERGVLGALLRNEGAPVSKEALIKEVWGDEFEGSVRVVDTVVKRLRKKLSPCGIQINTHYGRGLSIYRA